MLIFLANCGLETRVLGVTSHRVTEHLHLTSTTTTACRGQVLLQAAGSACGSRVRNMGRHKGTQTLCECGNQSIRLTQETPFTMKALSDLQNLSAGSTEPLLSLLSFPSTLQARTMVNTRRPVKKSRRHVRPSVFSFSPLFNVARVEHPTHPMVPSLPVVDPSPLL
jgi:hypothetical protein